MNLTLLGSTNAWGPNPFLKPPPAIPMTGSLSDGAPLAFRKYRTSLLVESSDGVRILVDIGPDFSRQLREFGLGVIEAILVTHPHLDHIGGLDDLNLYRPIGRLPIDTFATAKCWQTIRNARGFGYVTDIGLARERFLSDEASLRSFKMGQVTITPFPVEHSVHAPGSVGFVFEEESTDGQTRRVLYSGDLWAVSDPRDPLFQQQMDVAIIECDRWSGQVGPAFGGGHMSFEGIVQILTTGFLSNPRPRQLVLTHFGDHGPCGTGSSSEDWRREAIRVLRKSGLSAVIANEDAVIGYEGLELNL